MAAQSPVPSADFGFLARLGFSLGRRCERSSATLSLALCAMGTNSDGWAGNMFLQRIVRAAALDTSFISSSLGSGPDPDADEVSPDVAGPLPRPLSRLHHADLVPERSLRPKGARAIIIR